jgi:hypothetical protein
MDLQVPPEQPAQGVGKLVQRRVVNARLTFAQVVHEQVTYRAVGVLSVASIDDGGVTVGDDGLS